MSREIKNRILQWVDFNAQANCPTCPLFYECAYGWDRKQREKGRTATTCKFWRRMPPAPAPTGGKR